MRIIGGSLKRKKIPSPPAGATTRPIPDRVRESVFNLLRGHFEGVDVLDAFAGSGVIGLEAISRGARRCVFVEQDKRVARALERTITELGVADRAQVLVADALGARSLAACPDPVHIAFLDPPYALVQDDEGWRRVRAQFERVVGRLTPDGFAVLRTPWPFVSRPDPRPPERAGPTGSRAEIEVIDLDAPDADDLLDDLEASLAPPPPEPRDLTLDAAQGPETHVYRHTAVHLYMRPAQEPGSSIEATDGAPSR